MEICKRCKYESTCSVSSESDFCLNYEPRPLTNVDRVRGMGVDEMAEAFSNACPKDKTNRCCQYFAKGSRGCYDCWLDWLKQEVQDV